MPQYFDDFDARMGFYGNGAASTRGSRLTHRAYTRTLRGFFYGAAYGRSGRDGKAIFEARSAPPGCYQTLVAAVLAGTRSWDGVTPPDGYCK